MCGITAIFSPLKQPDEIIKAIHSTLIHRGPDYQNVVHVKTRENSCLYLLHNRLSIVDLSDAGIQPMYDAESGCYLIFNGEIYNFREIKNVLKAEGFIFKSNTDTEVVLKSYIHWGNDSVKKFNGMYAFMIWDPRVQRAFVARDRFGEKPLYYGVAKTGEVIFSSEMKAILSFPNFSPEINHTILEDFLGGRSILGNYVTPFKNIFQVPVATWLELSSKGRIVNSHQFWTAARKEELASVNIHEKDMLYEFLSLLTKSVQDRSKCDVQFGACLSGGLDSTTILGLLMKDKPEHFSSTISACYDNDPTISESKYLKAAIEHFKGDHILIAPTGQELLSDMEKLFWHQEYPVPSASMFLEWSVMKKAKELKNKVMLDGQGADELLGGYPYYFKLYQNEMLYRKEYSELIANTYLFRKYLKEIAVGYTDVERRIPPDLAYSFWALLKTYCKRKARGVLPEYRSQGESSSRDVHLSFTNMIEDGLSKTILQEQLHSADRNGMAFSIETRFPFLDYNLVDFSLKIPVKKLISQGMQKNILRQSVKGIIPEKIRLRKDKLGFLSPQDKWLSGCLKEWCFDMLTSSRLKDLNFYNKEKGLSIFSQFHRNPTPALSARLWRYASLGQWVTLFGQ